MHGLLNTAILPQTGHTYHLSRSGNCSRSCISRSVQPRVQGQTRTTGHLFPFGHCHNDRLLHLEIFLIWILASPAPHLSFSWRCLAYHQAPWGMRCAAKATFTTLRPTLPTLPQSLPAAVERRTPTIGSPDALDRDWGRRLCCQPAKAPETVIEASPAELGD